MCSMKCTGANSGGGTGSGAVLLYIVQCAVCSVMHVTGTLNQISLTNFLFLILAFQKYTAIICPKKKYTWAIRF